MPRMGREVALIIANDKRYSTLKRIKALSIYIKPYKKASK